MAHAAAAALAALGGVPPPAAPIAPTHPTPVSFGSAARLPAEVNCNLVGESANAIHFVRAHAHVQKHVSALHSPRQRLIVSLLSTDQSQACNVQRLL